MDWIQVDLGSRMGFGFEVLKVQMGLLNDGFGILKTQIEFKILDFEFAKLLRFGI